ncbi:hypothetical protein [Saccharopolyspora flava]|uniref:Uncharacterized protein n=1 Tax=Saccharopolyspora flava TaxID=95161 RepID=A0A1I6S0K9_9PSEU|nr:hypothetical protein [Saccharopolyspora flava]SFS70503.1 hypothetical protein SAMN05660874_02784 [Saccharopolyspora flava]
MGQEFTPTYDQLATVFDYAQLPMSADRLTTHYETYAGTLALIRQGAARELGETSPATAFKASWD